MSLNNLSLNKKQKGFSLIEVMVSLVVLSLGLLALTNLQTKSISNSTVAYTQTQATLFLQEIVEHLRIDKVAAASGNYNIALGAFGALASIDVNSSFAERERYNWFNNLNDTLPGAKAAITCDNTNLCVVEIQHDLSGITQQQTFAIIL